jgi:GntR family transcriptional repressor for pyruvate dehydrogenase complex
MIDKKKKLADFVIEEIKQMLKKGELKEGQKLPNQNEFANQLGISRLSLREALHTLSLMGVISQKPGSGTVILSGDPDMWVENLSAPVLSYQKATLELTETRKHLEYIIGKCAVDHITDKDIELLNDDIARMKTALDNADLSGYFKADMSFHYHIVSATHNRYLLHMFLTIRGLMEEFMKETFTVLPELMERSFHYHLQILDSLKKKDGESSSCFLQKHIEDIEISLRNYYASLKKGE